MIKVFELANKVEMGAVDVVEKLRYGGMNIRNHMVKLSEAELSEAEKILGIGTNSTKEATSAKKKAKKVSKKKL